MKAACAMREDGVVNVGQAGLSKMEVDLLVGDEFVSYTTGSYKARMFIPEDRRSEAQALAEG